MASPSRHLGNGATTSTATRKWAHTESTLLTLWFLVSVPLVIWDAAYCLLRPHSMPGGKWHTPWIPYALYGTVDYIYGWPAYESKNGFTSGQAVMNLVECATYLFYLFSLWKYGEPADRSGQGLFWQSRVLNGRIGAIANLVMFCGCVMTLSKTVLYWLCEYFSEFDNIGHNDLYSLVLLWIVPNGLWLVFPSVGIYLFGSEIVSGLEIANQPSGSPKPKSS